MAARSRISRRLRYRPTALRRADHKTEGATDHDDQISVPVYVADLVYQGERSFVGDYLTGHGWQVRVHPASEL